MDLAAIEALPLGGLERLQAVEDAVNALISPDPLRRDFLGHERLVGTLYRAVKPDPAALEFAGRVAGIADARRRHPRQAQSRTRRTSPTVMGQINGLLDESITGLTIREAGPPAIDLSKINFEALAQALQGIEAQEHRPRSAQGGDPRASWRS